MHSDEPARARQTGLPLRDIVQAVDLRKRSLLKAALSAGVLQFFAAPLLETVGEARAAGSVTLGFQSLPFAPVPGGSVERPGSAGDFVRVAPGYSVQIVIAHGDPLFADAPPWKGDASESAADQARQFGAHNDGMHFFPLPACRGDQPCSDHGILCVNHEYVDQGMLFADGMHTWSAEKVRKSLAAVGLSVLEVRKTGGHWEVVGGSRYARRITGATPCDISGPAAGHLLMRTLSDPAGQQVLGTLGNCAHGFTPWGTYLTCEENFNGYFGSARAFEANALEAAMGQTAAGFGYRWHEHEPRFDLNANQIDPRSDDAARSRNNEPNRFGWVVEIDPLDPQRAPIKRTSLGRFKREGAAHAVSESGRLVVYMGDDQQFEYLYKWVSARAFDRDDREVNRHLLDEGTLYVARFSAHAAHAELAGTGEWLELSMRVPLLREAFGGDLGRMLIDTRTAADLVGATPMDRPEWIAVHPTTKEVYCSLTNNTARAAEGKGGMDAANPRAANAYGHIIRWREAGGDAAATRFDWDIFILAGDPDLPGGARHTVKGDRFGSPDGLWFDRDGRLWIQTDISTSTLGRGAYLNMPNNALLAADPASREVRRFLTGPYGCEITGVLTTWDGQTMFVGIQHPGEGARDASDAGQAERVSKWPGCQGHGPAGRPRSAVVAISRIGGGRIGA